MNPSTPIVTIAAQNSSQAHFGERFLFAQLPIGSWLEVLQSQILTVRTTQ